MSIKKISFIFITSVLIFLANLGIITGQDRANETENSVLPEEVSTEKYHLKAKVFLRGEEKFLNKYIDRSDWIWPSENIEFGSKNSGWVAKNGKYTWKPGESSQFIQIPLQPQHPAEEISGINLGEVKIHYQNNLSENPVQLLLRPIDSGNKLSVVEDLANFSVKEVVFAQKAAETGVKYSITPSKKETLLDVSSAEWKEKNLSYLINRTLGFSLDSYWRYNQDTGNAVFKRRLHKNLRSIGVMDIVLKTKVKGTKLQEALDLVTKRNHLHCFLRIGYSKRPIPSEIINCREKLPWQLLESKGKYILRIQLSDFVRKQYDQGKKRVFLEEVTVYMPGQAEKFINNKIFETVQFYSNDDAQYKTLKLLSIIPDVTNKTKIKNFTLFAKPKNSALQSSFRLERVQVTSYSEYRKNFYTTAERRMIKQWGGPFLGDSLRDKRVERFKVIGYYPFEKLENNLFPFANDLNIRRNKELIELDLPMRARLKENTRLYLGVSEGVESIVSAQVVPIFEEHPLEELYNNPKYPLASISVIPNQSVKLDISGKNIDHLKIRIKFQKEPPSHFTLKEIALFEPVAVTRSQHLRTHFRIPMLKLKEKYIYPISLKNVNMEGIISNETWLDFGVHSIPANTGFDKVIKILDHPSLRIKSVSVENLKPLKKKTFKGEMMENALQENEYQNLARPQRNYLQLFLEELKRKLNITIFEEEVSKQKEVSKRVNDAYKQLKRKSNITTPGEGVSERVNDASKLLNREMKIPDDISKLELAPKSGDLAQANNHFWVNFIIKVLLFFITIIVIRWLWMQGWWFSLYGIFKMKTAQRLSKYPRFIHYYQKEPIRFWLAITGCFYFIGVLALLGGMGANKFLNIVCFGHLTIVPIWPRLMNNFRTKMEDNGIIFTEIIFSEIGSNQYVFGFIFFLLLANIFRIFHLEYFAEQFAILGFYILIAATILKFKTFFKTHKNLP